MNFKIPTPSFSTSSSFSSTNSSAKLNYNELIINMLTHTTILFAILSCLFVFYIFNLSEKHFSKEITNSINKSLKPGLVKVDPGTKLGLYNLKKFYTGTDEVTNMHNLWLIRTIVITNIAFFSISVIVAGMLKYHFGKEVNLQHILIENGLTFMFISIVELIFFLQVASQYVPTKPSTISSVFFNEFLRQ